MDEWYSSGNDQQRFGNNVQYSATVNVPGADMGGGFSGYRGVNVEPKSFVPSSTYGDYGKPPSSSFPSYPNAPGVGFQGNSLYNHPIGGNFGSIGQFDNEPPLLEELGINFEHIWAKTR